MNDINLVLTSLKDIFNSDTLHHHEVYSRCDFEYRSHIMIYTDTGIMPDDYHDIDLIHVAQL